MSTSLPFIFVAACACVTEAENMPAKTTAANKTKNVRVRASFYIVVVRYSSARPHMLLFKNDKSIVGSLIHVTQPHPIRALCSAENPYFINRAFKKTVTVILGDGDFL